MSFQEYDFIAELERIVNKTNRVKINEDSEHECDCECSCGCDCDFSEMVQALKSNSNLIAIREDGRIYEYDGCLLEINKGESKEMLPRVIPKVDYMLISSEYTVMERESWHDITSEELLMMIVNNEISNRDSFRAMDTHTLGVELSIPEIKMLTLREILDFKWQILVKIDLD